MIQTEREYEEKMHKLEILLEIDSNSTEVLTLLDEIMEYDEIHYPIMDDTTKL